MIVTPSRLQQNGTSKIVHTKNIHIKYTPGSHFIKVKISLNFKGSRTGHFVKVSLWYASLLTNTRFHFTLE